MEVLKVMYQEDDLVMISALQHLLFCPRQCALIHIEQQWLDNRYTAEGQILHERVHKPGRESRVQVRVEFDLSLRSLELGIIGKADIVEFHKGDSIWTPFPVEYKRGRPKKDDSDRVQLCAQALCLEEMLETDVTEGALYYGKLKKRSVVAFDETLRALTKQTILSLHDLLASKKTPAPVYSKKCDKCSFFDFCLPKVIGKKSVKNYLKKIVKG